MATVERTTRPVRPQRHELDLEWELSQLGSGPSSSTCSVCRQPVNDDELEGLQKRVGQSSAVIHLGW